MNLSTPHFVDDEKDESLNEDITIPSSNYILLKSTSIGKKNVKKVSNYSFLATSSLAFAQILTFTTITLISGFTSLQSNPFWGPSLHDLDRWGSKNPKRIIQYGEYWRVVSALFLSIGLTDLLFSILVLACLGYHLEKRWGGLKFLIFYIFSGIGGNVFGTIYVPSAISVGSGGSIFGLLGAMHVDVIFSFFHEQSQKKTNYVLDQDTDNNESGDDEESFLQLSGDSDYSDDEEEDKDGVKRTAHDIYVTRSSSIILGFLCGVLAMALIGIYYPQSSLSKEKDWAVLYGGMISGLFIGLVWQLYISIKARERRMTTHVLCGFFIIVIPFIFDCFLSLKVSQSILNIM